MTRGGRPRLVFFVAPSGALGLVLGSLLVLGLLPPLSLAQTARPARPAAAPDSGGVVPMRKTVEQLREGRITLGPYPDLARAQAVRLEVARLRLTTERPHREADGYAVRLTGTMREADVAAVRELLGEAGLAEDMRVDYVERRVVRFEPASGPALAPVPAPTISTPATASAEPPPPSTSPASGDRAPLEVREPPAPAPKPSPPDAGLPPERAPMREAPPAVQPARAAGAVAQTAPAGAPSTPAPGTAEDLWVEVRGVQRTIPFQQLRLGVFRTRDEAESALVAARLASAARGFPLNTQLVRVPEGYLVTLGEYTREANLERAKAFLADEGLAGKAHVVIVERRVSFFAPDVSGSKVRLPRETAERLTAEARPRTYIPELDVTVPGAAPKVSEEEDVVLVFGQKEELEPFERVVEEPAGAAPAEPGLALGGIELSIDYVRAELGLLVNPDNVAQTTNYLGASVRADWRPPGMENLDVRAGIRADVYNQTGGPSFTEAELDYEETYVRGRIGNTRLTVGAQKVLWARVDEIPPTDRLSVQDITRFNLDALPDRRRAVPAIRAEYTAGEHKVDAVLVPLFRSAELPDQESVWFPIDQREGRFLGTEASNPLFAQALRLGSIGEFDDYESFGGAGVRFSRTGAGIDFALTAQRARHSLPYYEVDPTVLGAVLAGIPLPAAIAAGTGPTLREVHPWTWVFGGDLAFVGGGVIWRLEGAYLTDVPVTTPLVQLSTTDALEVVGAAEWFPGDSNTRVNLQIAYRNLLTDDVVLDQETHFGLNGEIEHPFAQERWRLTTRFAVGLEPRDLYLNPEVRYVGLEPHEFYLAAHIFEGKQESVNGFFKDNDLVTLGWRARF